MSVNIYEDTLQHAELFGKDVLYTNWLIPRDSVPESWYCYDLRGSDQEPTKKVELVDLTSFHHVGTVLSPLPLKRKGEHCRRVNDTFYLHGEELTLGDFCEAHGLEIPADNRKYILRPASPDEAGLFYAMKLEQDIELGVIGHVRMDFGRRGTEFWHTWHPRGPEELNSPEFKAELQQVVDALRATGPLKDLRAMSRYCYENGGAIPGGWPQNYGYIVETEHYQYCLRCNPVQGDYNAYLTTMDLREQKLHMEEQQPEPGMRMGGMAR